MLEISGYSRDLIRNRLKDNVLWREPRQSICSRAATVKARDFMEKFSGGALIEADATLDEAIHQMVIGRFQSVTNRGKVMGVLRLSDVFTKICDHIQTCGY